MKSGASIDPVTPPSQPNPTYSPPSLPYTSHFRDNTYSSPALDDLCACACNVITGICSNEMCYCVQPCPRYVAYGERQGDPAVDLFCELSCQGGQDECPSGASVHVQLLKCQESSALERALCLQFPPTEHIVKTCAMLKMATAQTLVCVFNFLPVWFWLLTSLCYKSICILHMVFKFVHF